jgi:flagellar M-ring protein FliF
VGNFSTTMAALRNWWETAAPVTRAAATGMAIFVLVGLCFAAFMATSPDYVPIYHGVSGKDASAIEATLRDHSIEMRFSDSDGSVSVPAKDESDAIMYVEAAGVLSKDSSIEGIEQLDKIPMGTSTDVERERILAANEGELARKLMQLDPVASAAVTISPGSDTSLFSTETPPAASVILSLKPGETLDDSQVKGIVNLVAHAVTGLTVANVTLTDQTGTPLWKDNGQGENAFGDGQPLDESQKYSEVVRKKVQGMLDSTLGPRKAIVTVNAELNFDQSQTHSIEHTAAPGSQTGLPVSVQEKDESYTGGGGAVGGAPSGTGSNLNAPSYAAVADSGSGGSYKSGVTTTNYENNTEDTITQTAPGTIKLISVAALVDTSVSADDLPKIKDVIAAAIGASPGDADRYVTVQQMKFDNSALIAQTAQMQSIMSQQMWENVSRSLAVCVVACVLLFLLMRSGRGAGSRRFSDPRLAMVGGGSNIGLLHEIPEASLDIAPRDERPLRVEDVLAEMPEVVPRRMKRRAAAPSIEEQHDLKMESIQEMIGTNSEAVALLLKGWMAEESKFS